MTTTESSAARQRAVGVYLGAVQFLFAATWIVYVIYVPQLAAQAGLPKSAVAWILMADQLVFFVADYAAGVAADRVSRVVGRLGPIVLAATLLSCAAFFALPYVAPQGSTALVVVVMAWAVTSSALRAPPLALLGKHVARPSQPALLALSLLGLGIANALAPYLGMRLRDVDPRIPFAVSSIALALVTIGLVAAERLLARNAGVDVAVAAEPSSIATSAATAPTSLVLVAALLAALAFQVHVFIDSAPLYLRHAAPADLVVLSPVFWIGFNLAMLPLSLVAKHGPPARTLGLAALLAAVAAAGAAVAPNLGLLVAIQCVAGAAWAGVLVAAFAWALAHGGASRAGRFAGAVSSVLALATLARMASVAAGWPRSPALHEALAWWPTLGWLVAAAVLLALAASRPSRVAVPGSTPP